MSFEEQNLMFSNTTPIKVFEIPVQSGNQHCAPCSFTYPFINVIVLELDKASTDSSNVALLIGESHSASTFGVLQLWVCINASIADTSIQTVHNHCQFNCKKSIVKCNRFNINHGVAFGLLHLKKHHLPYQMCLPKSKIPE